jgi:hypothetical protein
MSIRRNLLPTPATYGPGVTAVDNPTRQSFYADLVGVEHVPLRPEDLKALAEQLAPVHV